ncbi:iron ABC transporter permease [Paenibacillus sp. J2TS4]|uniref:ABC transporter permease n=1 Tax=Paenibacillus sp. J2TS4 TaxID=2807194 RepID=UPI001B2D9245|nr:iron ABC transporter permease [Paenibacillus sp. J2TS4]GIP34780.1 ABC transporter permease [Paenibacillus sp. J2TS4]
MKIRILLRNIRRHTNGWLITSLIGAAVILLPIVYVLSGLIQPANENWNNVTQYLLKDYIIGSAKLVLFTGFFATLIGVVLAWLVVGYTFPLRRFFRWALMLPLAVPPYIAAFTYATMTSYTGTIQATLRNQFDINLAPGMIEIMSTRGAVFIMTLFLFPYVFMISRTFLEKQSASYIENAMLLGHKRFSLFFRVVLPISRPAIIAGGMLVVFEVLSDYGVASYFGVQTLSTAIFQTWFGMYDVDSAIKLAAWLMIVIIGIFAIERFLRRNRKFNSTTSQSRPLNPRPLKGFAALGATLLCSIVFLLSFLIPVVQIIVWTTWTYRKVWRSDFMDLMMNSLTGALIGTCIIIVIALLAARTSRTISSSLGYAISRLMTAGYAIPGAIIAIGVLAIFIALDRQLSPFYAWLGKGEGVLILSLSLSMLVTGYIIRFMATGYNAIESGYEKIPRTYSEASRMLGRSSTSTFFKIELPLLKGAVFTGFVLTFVEIVKELPLTLLLRPFNFDTLATRTYQYAMDERIFEAALPSLLLIGISLISVLFILMLEKEKRT